MSSAAPALAHARPRVFAHSSRDALLLALPTLQGAALALTAPLDPASSPLLAAAWGLAFALGLWWCSNTVSHNHLHNPIFRARAANRALSLYLTLLLGIPQSLWRQRHLAHHAGPSATERPRRPRHLRLELAFVLVAWSLLALAAPAFWLAVYLPAWGLGLGLCALQGRHEHLAGGRAVPAGVSHYGRLHNLLWLNDGYHAEHHARPRDHWTELPARRLPAAPTSPLPPALRPLAAPRARALCALERLALRLPSLRRFMLSTHRSALARLLPRLGPAPARVLIVGGGLYPRTALALRDLRPDVHLTVLDASTDSLATARALLPADEHLTYVHGRYPFAEAAPAGLIVLPLAYQGDPAARFVPGPTPRLVHAWLWEARHLPGTTIHPLLFKRLVLVPAAARPSAALTAS